ncbi:serine/threonine protein phosphatase, partial [Leptolyngbya sp. FACHB-36]|nr:serine/threonine protein phosphatase [Leptolyngbya sp. FACHB-36]
MHSTSASIHCPNPLCQTLNLESQRFCQQCRTPLQKRYLWAVGAAEPLVPGTLLYDRYWVKQDAIVLDTQPALSPMPPERIPGRVQPYLRLSAYSLHVPQVYGIVPMSVAHTEADVLLLEHAPIYEADTSAEATLMPELAAAWGHSALRQLNWLWQIAQLWEPLSREGVASTLLTPTLLRVEGSLVRLLELRPDRS